MPAPAQYPASLEYHPDIPDRAAIQAVRQGDREMFGVIVRRYNPRLFRVGMVYLRNRAEAEDAMQNSYLKAFLQLQRFEGNAAFATWLTRIMINECLMLLRRKRRRPVENNPAQLPPEDHTAAIDASPTEILHISEMKAVLEQAIQRLPRHLRAVYLLREVQQLSVAETAACLSLTPANVKVRLHRAREQLKAELLHGASGVELFDYPAAHCEPMTARVMRAIRVLPAAASAN